MVKNTSYLGIPGQDPVSHLAKLPRRDILLSGGYDYEKGANEDRGIIIAGDTRILLSVADGVSRAYSKENPRWETLEFLNWNLGQKHSGGSLIAETLMRSLEKDFSSTETAIPVQLAKSANVNIRHLLQEVDQFHDLGNDTHGTCGSVVSIGDTQIQGVSWGDTIVVILDSQGRPLYISYDELEIYDARMDGILHDLCCQIAKNDYGIDDFDALPNGHPTKEEIRTKKIWGPFMPKLIASRQENINIHTDSFCEINETGYRLMNGQPIFEELLERQHVHPLLQHRADFKANEFTLDIPPDGCHIVLITDGMLTDYNRNLGRVSLGWELHKLIHALLEGDISAAINYKRHREDIKPDDYAAHKEATIIHAQVFPSRAA